jgi:hypothetical protein
MSLENIADESAPTKERRSAQQGLRLPASTSTGAQKKRPIDAATD